MKITERVIRICWITFEVETKLHAVMNIKKSAQNKIPNLRFNEHQKFKTHMTKSVNVVGSFMRMKNVCVQHQLHYGKDTFQMFIWAKKLCRTQR